MPVSLITAVAVFGLTVAFGIAPQATRVQAQSAQPTFVGSVSGTDAFIGIVSDGADLIAYVCDGVGAHIADFYEGSLRDAANGVLTLETPDSADLLTLNIDAGNVPTSGGALTGTFVTTDGVSHPFSADVASGPGGLYRTDETLSDGSEAEGGWVVLNDSSIRGSVGSNQGPPLQMSAAPNLQVPSFASSGPPPCNLSIGSIGGPGGTSIPIEAFWEVASGPLAGQDCPYPLPADEQSLVNLYFNMAQAAAATANSAPLNLGVQNPTAGGSANAHVAPAQVCSNSPKAGTAGNPPACHH